MADHLKVVDLSEKREQAAQTAQQPIVSLLEDLLDAAKAGRITSFVFIMGCSDGNLGSAQWVHEKASLMQLLGEATALQQRVIDLLRHVNDGQI